MVGPTDAQVADLLIPNDRRLSIDDCHFTQGCIWSNALNVITTEMVLLNYRKYTQVADLQRWLSNDTREMVMQRGNHCHNELRHSFQIKSMKRIWSNVHSDGYLSIEDRQLSTGNIGPNATANVMLCKLS